MAQNGLKVKLDGRTYTLTMDYLDFTLGEAEFLQEHFGLQDVRDYNPLEPRQLTGVVAVAVRKARQDLADGEVLELVRGKLKMGTVFDAINKQVEDEKADPPTAGTANGGPAKTQRKGGSRPSPASTASGPGT